MSIRIKIFLSITLFCLGQSALSQKALVVSDTIPLQDTTMISDSLFLAIDTLGNDSLKLSVIDYEVSPDGLTDEIDYGSSGRKKIDIKNKIVHLWEDAYVNYQDIQVRGEYITFDFENNIATAVATYDENGKLRSKATFVEGESTFQYDYLKYNFKSEKAIVRQAVTKEGDLFVHGGLTKFVAAKDSTQDDFINNKDAIITSCNLDHPHYGIKANKIKIVPNKLAVIGPSHLEIADVPTPLWLPFGFFPISTGKSSGLILPRNYDFSQELGFGLKNLGYYLPINDYLDAKITGDIFLRGSWRINSDLNYNKKYKYRGLLNASRSSFRREDNETGGYFRQIAYQFRWTHNQDAKAHPYRSFNTSIDLKTAGFNRLNRTDVRGATEDNISSSIRYTYKFGASAWDFSGGANFTQSLSQGTVTMTAPEAKINMRRVQPFKRKEAIGKEKWYEKIGMTYSSQFKNYIQATDTTFYTREAWEDAKYGVNHKATASASFKFLKYFNFNPSVNYTEIWYFKEIEQTLLQELVIDTTGQIPESDGTITYLQDTTYGRIDEEVNNTFLPFRTGSANAEISTKLFWTEQKSKGLIRGFRHTTTPAFSLNYGPDSRTQYQRTIDSDYRENVFAPVEYSIIPQSVFNASQSDASLATRLSLQNLIEIKYYSRKDSTAKKLQLTNFTFSTDYNFVKDSLKLADPRLGGRSSFFKNRLTINYDLRWSAYKLDKGEEVDVFFFQDGFEAPRLEDFTLRTNTRLKISDIRALLKGKNINESTRSNKTLQDITLGELFDNFGFEYKIDYRFLNTNGAVERGISAHSFNLRGDIQLTENWQLNLGNFGYDFVRKGYTYPDLGFSRDLHCWTMAFSWQPRGAFALTSTNTSVFSFSIRAKSGTLDFLKYDYNKSNFDSTNF